MSLALKSSPDTLGRISEPNPPRIGKGCTWKKCLWCRFQFMQRRNWQLFCRDEHRKLFFKKYGSNPEMKPEPQPKKAVSWMEKWRSMALRLMVPAVSITLNDVLDPPAFVAVIDEGLEKESYGPSAKTPASAINGLWKQLKKEGRL